MKRAVMTSIEHSSILINHKILIKCAAIAYEYASTVTFISSTNVFNIILSL